ncbi:MAG: NTP transferase domain-containing protein [Candidatus Nitrohelix vancouverensis]|uniref:NTP transferase domain-containing protein n=1 Tax=Candidatus Nitrohelix vancouverensis TaxID=2705534 RepID=A0A7T0G384_9BACT|nr:MAG: NTP transferase domain-containing protein [Candidatus Nitrohelix vancouverensis]
MNKENNKIGAVIQARMGSTRRPGKSLYPFAGRPMIEHIVRRIQLIPGLDLVALAIPDLQSEQALVDAVSATGVRIIQGPEDDVLERYVMAGDALSLTHIARICGDCPWVDLELAERLIESHLATGADFSASADPVPLGSGLEIIKLDALKAAARESFEPYHKEHVAPFIIERPERFHLNWMPAPQYLAHKECRLTVDTEEDLQFQDRLCAELTTSPLYAQSVESILSLLESRPDLLQINATIPQKDWRKEK